MQTAKLSRPKAPTATLYGTPHQPFPAPINFVEVLKRLGRAGYSLEALAFSVNLSRRDLSGYAAGAQPQHALGERLVHFAINAMDWSRDDLPRLPR